MSGSAAPPRIRARCERPASAVLAACSRRCAQLRGCPDRSGGRVVGRVARPRPGAAARRRFASSRTRTRVAAHVAPAGGDDGERARRAGRRLVDRSAGTPCAQRRGLPRLDRSSRRAPGRWRSSRSSAASTTSGSRRREATTAAEHGVSAGVAVFMTSKMFFEYRGAIFWKMTAGMGDIVFAPMYEVLRKRGVEFEFFHRVDTSGLPRPDPRRVETVTDGPPGRAAPEHERLRAAGPRRRPPRFPRTRPSPISSPGRPGIGTRRSSRTAATGPTPRARVLRDGFDYDVRVRDPRGHGAPSPRALSCSRIVTSGSRWSSNVKTTATQALQLWLRPDERRSAGPIRVRR